MSETRSPLRLDDIRWPAIPGGVLEDHEVLQAAASAYRGLSLLYDRLSAELGGPTALLARIVRGDWRRLIEPVVENVIARAAESAAERGLEPETGDCRPSEQDVVKIVEALKDEPPPAFLDALEAIARRCLLCTNLVPLGSPSAEVRDVFLLCVESEDQHLSQLIWLRESLAASEG
ncbi:MAG: hypothetical protein JXA90_13575 [Planctomycetes bacterium]|nr:hypothetical protein [Planctomycetota bacterium]